MYETMGGGLILLIVFILIIGAVAKWRLFVKCDQPGVAAFVPVWDAMIIMKIVGRPTWHWIQFLIPVWNIGFLFYILLQLCRSFGKYTVLDMVFAIVFNVFYVLNLGLAYNEIYYGPVHRRPLSEMKQRKTAYAA